MRHRVTAKQPNSHMCLVCGLSNSAGLKAAFYELESEQLLAVYQPREDHQGYPGRLHGGIAAAILDETIGRAIRLRHGDDVWGVTMEVNVRYRQPLPLDAPLRVLARIERETRRHFEGVGEILSADGRPAVEGRGKYLIVPPEKIADFDLDQLGWRVTNSTDDPSDVEL